MRTYMTSLGGTGRRARALPALVLGLALGITGCDSLVDVENPNNVSADDLTNPVAAPSLVSGAVATVAQAWGSALTTVATASDELVFVGSRDSWDQLDDGDLSDPTNEFTDAAFPFIGEARWMSDTTIRLLEFFDGNGDLADRTLLARAYLNGAIIYTAIADWFDDFPIASNGMVAAAPVGPSNMSTLYDIATTYLTSGLTVARDEGDEDLETAILAMRASVAHRKAVWGLLNPPLSGPPASPLLAASAAADQDALDALALIGSADWAFYLNYSDITIQNTIGAWTNERADLRIDVRYGVPSGAGTTIIDIALLDPIDNVKDPAVTEIIKEFAGTPPYPATGPPQRDIGPLRAVSKRELLLIRAEHAAATGADAVAEGFINQYRAMNAGLTAYDRTAPGARTVAQMLEYHRSAALFLQGRRLADMYRFGTRDLNEWKTTSEAWNQPGTFLPITAIECNANPGAC